MLPLKPNPIESMFSQRMQHFGQFWHLLEQPSKLAISRICIRDIGFPEVKQAGEAMGAYQKRCPALVCINSHRVVENGSAALAHVPCPQIPLLLLATSIWGLGLCLRGLPCPYLNILQERRPEKTDGVPNLRCPLGCKFRQTGRMVRGSASQWSSSSAALAASLSMPSAWSM